MRRFSFANLHKIRNIYQFSSSIINMIKLLFYLRVNLHVFI